MGRGEYPVLKHIALANKYFCYKLEQELTTSSIKDQTVNIC